MKAWSKRQSHESMQNAPAKSPEMAKPPANENALDVCGNHSMLHPRQMPRAQVDLRHSTVEHQLMVQRLCLLCCTALAGHSGNNHASERIQRTRMPASPRRTGLPTKTSD
jgi:hypothetical protein